MCESTLHLSTLFIPRLLLCHFIIVIYTILLWPYKATILVKNLETLVCVSPSPVLIWVLQWSQCFKIRVAQHWGGRG